MTRLIKCPVCWQPCEHTRGYLAEHEVTVTRGEIVTGHRMCDGSNSKPDVPLKTVQLVGNCTSCGARGYDEFTETFPGSHDGAARISLVECEDEDCTEPVLLTDNHVIAESD